MTRVALVGSGRWGRRLEAPLAARFDLAVAGREAVKQVLADPAIDAVVLATPIETHAELALRALEAGKHVFVEKPLAASAADARRVADAAGDRILFVGHLLLYHPLFRRLQAEPFASARLSWRKVGTFDSDLFWNLGSHSVSLALALAGGPPDEVELLATRGVVTECDLAIVRFGFGGREVLIDIDRTGTPSASVVTVSTQDGRVLIWHDEALYELRDEQPVLVAEGGDPLAVELDAFRAALEEGAPFPSDAGHAIAVVETIERIKP
jgi:UDP-2-acetamido-3-amino-2,3-dideoxy-glucuronate N-acetyltransferase